MSHPIYRYSSIARPLEPQYPTNLAVLILLPLIAIGLAVFSVVYYSAPTMEAVVTGLSGAMAAFLAWALARELDPDRNQAAFVAMGLAVLAIGFGFAPDLWVTASILMSIRVVVRTVGPPARLTDLALVIALAAAAAFLSGAWWVALVAAAAIAIDGWLDRCRPVVFLSSGLALTIALAAIAVTGWDMSAMESLLRGWIVAALVVGGVAIAMMLTCPPVKSVCDATGDPLNRRRIQIGASLALAAGFLAMLGGQEALLGSLPIWAALAGVTEGRAMPKRKL
tara:strand:+ start:286 stop:1128 length:843 start_codon:yes stop_codon:yes gene_type:complete